MGILENWEKHIYKVIVITVGNFITTTLYFLKPGKNKWIINTHKKMGFLFCGIFIRNLQFSLRLHIMKEINIIITFASKFTCTHLINKQKKQQLIISKEQGTLTQCAEISKCQWPQNIREKMTCKVVLHWEHLIAQNYSTYIQHYNSIFIVWLWGVWFNYFSNGILSPSQDLQGERVSLHLGLLSYYICFIYYTPSVAII